MLKAPIFLKKLPKIGMRSIKTVIATFVAIIVSSLFNFETPFYATFTAFLCIQGSILETSEMALKRGVGTLIGGVFSLAYLVLMPENIYLIPLGLLFIIYLYNVFEKSDLITITCVLFLVIVFGVNTEQDFDTVSYVIDRVGQTFVGIIIAMFVNYYIKPPNPFSKLKVLNDDMTEFVKKNISPEGELQRVNNIEEYRLKVHELANLIQLYYKESIKKHYDMDIDYYVEHLYLFKSAYSHFFILNSIKEGTNLEVQNYHISKLLSIRGILAK